MSGVTVAVVGGLALAGLLVLLWYNSGKKEEEKKVGTGVTGGVTTPGSASDSTVPKVPTEISAASSPDLSNTPVLTKSILFTKNSTGVYTDEATFAVAEIVVRVLESNGTRTLTKDDYSDAICDDGSNTGFFCTNLPAANAIDGNNNTFANTDKVNPKLLFVLKVPKKVVSVTVYNRADCCKDRLNGVKLSLLSSSDVPIKECILTADATYVCTP